MFTLPLILAIIPCLISLTLANNGCNDAMLTNRIRDVDFPNLWELWIPGETDSAVPDFTVVPHCRAHSFTSPKWLNSTVVALKIYLANQTYYAVLHYNSCDETTSMFAAPVVLIPITRHNSTDDDAYITDNTNADFCYNCVNNVSTNYCQACNSMCMTEEEDDLDLCYGPTSNNCCRYIENDDCAASCEEGSHVDEMSTCVLDHLCIRDNLCHTGNCTNLSPTNYSCSCPNTHFGANCSIMNPCLTMDQCNNNGNCSISKYNPYFTCKCVAGVEGVKCEHNALCNDTVNPCMNGGTCGIMGADNYACSCDSGYSGMNCQTGGVPLTGLIAGAAVAIVIITIIIVLVVIICVLYFCTKGKKGKIEISKKTSKVYPDSGNGTVAEKEPMLDQEKP